MFQIQTHLSSCKDILSTHIFECSFDFWSLGSCFFLLGFQWNFHTSLEWSVGMPNPEAEPQAVKGKGHKDAKTTSFQKRGIISQSQTKQFHLRTHQKTMWQFVGYRNTIGKKLQGMIFQYIINPCSSMTWLCRDLLGSQRIPAPIPSSCTWPWWYVKWTHLFSHYLVMVLKVLERCSKIYRIVILNFGCAGQDLLRVPQS